MVDVGAYDFDPQDDFPDFISKVARQVSADPENTCAVIFGGSGQGEAMVANRFPQVRATVFYGGSDEIINLSREHNDANVLALGARFVTIDAVKKIEARFFIISNEIGMGVHAETEIGRKFTDLQGWANQYIAEQANQVILMVSGIPVNIKNQYNHVL